MAGTDAMVHRYHAACSVAREAGELARRLFDDRDAIGFSFKGPQDYLTEADAEVERFVRRRLAEAFPDDGFMGEETGGRVGRSAWIVDPIDGTSNFARGIPHFCVSIAYMRDGRPELGAIANPMTHELFSARRGGGAWCNDRAMKVSKSRDIRASEIELGWSARRSAGAYTDMVNAVLNAGASFRRAGSGALGIAYVADGRSEGYCELHINAWDCLAGLVMVDEAGGWTNDFLAGEGLRRGNIVIAAAPGIKDALLAATGLKDAAGTLSSKGRRAPSGRKRKREKTS